MVQDLFVGLPEALKRYRETGTVRCLAQGSRDKPGSQAAAVGPAANGMARESAAFLALSVGNDAGEVRGAVEALPSWAPCGSRPQDHRRVWPRRDRRAARHQPGNLRGSVVSGPQKTQTSAGRVTMTMLLEDRIRAAYADEHCDPPASGFEDVLRRRDRDEHVELSVARKQVRTALLDRGRGGRCGVGGLLRSKRRSHHALQPAPLSTRCSLPDLLIAQAAENRTPASDSFAIRSVDGSLLKPGTWVYRRRPIGGAAGPARVGGHASPFALVSSTAKPRGSRSPHVVG